MKPLNNLISIIIDEIEEKRSASGLYIPQDKWGEKQHLATIVAVSDTYEGPLQADMKVVINPYAVLDTPHKEQKLIKDVDVLAIWQ